MADFHSGVPTRSENKTSDRFISECLNRVVSSFALITRTLLFTVDFNRGAISFELCSKQWFKICTVGRFVSWEICTVGRYAQLGDLYSLEICTVWRFVQLGDLYSWEICTVGRFVQLGDMYSWEICTVGRYVQLGDLYSWEICTVGRFVQLGDMYSREICTVGRFVQLGDLYSWEICTVGRFVQLGDSRLVHAKYYLGAETKKDMMDLVCSTRGMGTAVAQWLGCRATNRKVAFSIPASVSGFFIDIILPIAPWPWGRLSF